MGGGRSSGILLVACKLLSSLVFLLLRHLARPAAACPHLLSSQLDRELKVTVDVGLDRLPLALVLRPLHLHHLPLLLPHLPLLPLPVLPLPSLPLCSLLVQAITLPLFLFTSLLL
jgi:hypothetical protein